MKDFEGNECEWPIFYTFLIIDGVFKNNTEQIEEYQAELRKCIYADANGGQRMFENYLFDQMLNLDIIRYRSGHHDVLCTGW